MTEDSLSGNLRRLSREAGDMEIVLFDLPGASNIPEPSEIRGLRSLRGELEMSCTVHFASELRADCSGSVMERSAEECLRLIELFSSLEPFAWILHVTGSGVNEREAGHWLENARSGLERITKALPDKSALCLETLDYDLSRLTAVIEEMDISVCLDAGHLLARKEPILEQIEKFFSHTRVVHLHGVRPDGTDHADLSYLERGLLKEIIEKYARDKKERVITIEVFENDYDRSIEVLKEVFRGGSIQC